MRTGSRSQMGRQAVAALYVLATLLLGLASSTHGASIHDSWPNDSRRQSETRVTATSTPDDRLPWGDGARRRAFGNTLVLLRRLRLVSRAGARRAFYFPFHSSARSFDAFCVRDATRPRTRRRTRRSTFARAPRARIKVEKLRGRRKAVRALSMPANRLPSSGRFARPLSRRERARATRSRRTGNASSARSPLFERERRWLS